MKYTRVLSGFATMRDAELLRRAHAILEAMSSNTAVFAEPVPALADVQAAVDDYQAKLALASQTKGLPDVSLKNESKQALTEVLQRLAFYVNTTADGHLPTLYASGFEVISPRITGLFPGTPQRLRLIDGHVSGSVRFDVDRIAGSDIAYDYSYATTTTLDEAPTWGEAISTRSSTNNVINGLIPHTVVHIRVRAVNANGVSDWCNSERLIVR